MGRRRVPVREVEQARIGRRTIRLMELAGGGWAVDMGYSRRGPRMGKRYWCLEAARRRFEAWGEQCRDNEAASQARRAEKAAVARAKAGPPRVWRGETIEIARHRVVVVLRPDPALGRPLRGDRAKAGGEEREVRERLPDDPARPGAWIVRCRPTRRERKMTAPKGPCVPRGTSP